jgi:hypothetical protein
MFTKAVIKNSAITGGSGQPGIAAHSARPRLISTFLPPVVAEKMFDSSTHLSWPKSQKRLLHFGFTQVTMPSNPERIFEATPDPTGCTSLQTITFSQYI